MIKEELSKEELKEEKLIVYLNAFFFILISLMFYAYFELKYKPLVSFLPVGIQL